jgi:hypothetical protein
MAFYYPYDDANSKAYADIWHTIEIVFNTPSSIQINYSVKKLHLIETKYVRILHKFNIGLFKIGQSYLDRDVYLNGACVRDVLVNNEYIFKMDQFDLNNNNQQHHQQQQQQQLIKFGCDQIENKCLQDDEKSMCQNNSTCVHRWFSQECIGCNLPFYGKQCQLGKSSHSTINVFTI